jgi:hypothetical protein
MNKLNLKQKAKVKRAWVGVDRYRVAGSMKIDKRVIDQYANGLQLPGAKRTIIISALTGIPTYILRPDIFKG